MNVDEGLDSNQISFGIGQKGDYDKAIATLNNTQTTFNDEKIPPKYEEKVLNPIKKLPLDKGYFEGRNRSLQL